MNNLFLVFTALSALTVSVLFILGYFTFLNKKISWQRWLFIVLGMLLLTNFIILFNKGNEVNNRIAFNFKVPNELQSVRNANNDSIISQKILYQYLLSIRAPHAKIMLIQALIESGEFKSALFKKNHNLFGMKIVTNRASSSPMQNAGYQSYNNYFESVTDFCLWEYSRGVETISDQEFINFLSKIYAEDPNYALKIRKKLKEIDFKKLEN